MCLWHQLAVLSRAFIRYRYLFFHIQRLTIGTHRKQGIFLVLCESVLQSTNSLGAGKVNYRPFLSQMQP